MKNSKAYPSIVLGAICLVVALLLSVINSVTAPIITRRENDKAFESLQVVLPNGSGFKPISTDDLPEGVQEAYSATGGFVFRVKGNGRNGDIVLMVGIDAEGKIAGTSIISESESKGYKEPAYAKLDGENTAYKGQTLETYQEIIVAGSTMTSSGYAQAIKVALQAFAKANGVEVDTRTPEEILQANCNTALGTTDKVFTKWFATEVITGVDKIYETKDNSGYVFVIGEEFVGVDASGVKTAGASAENAAKASAAYATITGSTMTAITLPAGVDTMRVSKAYLTASGNYVFELNGLGYAIDYGTPISIKVSMTADGAIIDCYTGKHRETKGYGDKCATEEYCSQWVGATADDVVITVETPDEEEVQIGKDCTDLGAISGATFTTHGYQTAIKAAFAALELITAEGGN